MTLIIISLFIGVWTGGEPAAPDTLNLEYCYARIQNHYPLARKIELRQKIIGLNKKIVNTTHYPQLSFSASASWQSEVTEFPGEAPFAPQLSKDQYKASVDVSQSIYNGGAVEIRKNLEEVRGRQQQLSTEMQLHQLKGQVNQIYFGILLAQKQQKVISTLSEDLRTQLKSIKSKVANGVLLPGQQYTLQAELIKVQQDSIEAHANILAGYNILGELIGLDLDPGTALNAPDVQVNYGAEESLPQLRPRFALFKSNRQALEYQKKLVGASKMPSLSAFGTAAYGRPGFNVFENDLHPFYIIGLRLQWNFRDWNNGDEQQQILSLKQKSINQEQQAFERQLRVSLSQIRHQIETLEDQIKRDEQIISLREKVVAEKASQMKNGVITATEYITELNNVTQARLSMMMHSIQLSKAKIKYQTTLGIPVK